MNIGKVENYMAECIVSKTLNELDFIEEIKRDNIDIYQLYGPYYTNETPLTLSIKSNKIELAKYIINEMIKNKTTDHFNDVDSDIKPPLLLSIKCNKAEIAHLLIDNGADTHIFNNLDSIISNNYYMDEPSLYCENNNDSIFMKILKKFKDFDNMSSHIKHAIRYDRPNMCYELIKRNIKMYEKSDKEEIMYKLMIKKWINCIEHLFTIYDSTCSEIQTILLNASRESLDILKVLVKYIVDINKQDDEMTILHYAMLYSRYDIALYLINELKAKTNIINKAGNIWFHFAMDITDEKLLNNFLSILKKDLDNKLIDINTSDKNNNNLLFHSIRNNNIIISSFLIENKINIISQKYKLESLLSYNILNKLDNKLDIFNIPELKDVINVLHIVLYNHIDREDLIKKHLNNSNINTCIVTPLLMAMKNKSSDDLIKYILNLNVDIFDNIEICLEHAINRSTNDVLILLLDRIKIANSIDIIKKIAIPRYRESKYDLLNKLKTFGYDIDVQDTNGNTILHNYCIDNNELDEDELSSLFRLGVNYEIKNNNKLSGLDTILHYYLDTYYSLKHTSNIYRSHRIVRSIVDNYAKYSTSNDYETNLKYLIEHGHTLLATYLLINLTDLDAKLYNKNIDLYNKIKEVRNGEELCNETYVCPICLETKTDLYITSCAHIYCNTCMLNWINASEKASRKIKCPLCFISLKI